MIFALTGGIIIGSQNIVSNEIASEVIPQNIMVIINALSAFSNNNIRDINENSSVNNNSETNKTENFRLENKQGVQIFTKTNGDNNEINNYVSGDILIGDKALHKLDPVFVKSIKEFTTKLDSVLQDSNKIPNNDIEELKKYFLNLSKEYEEIKPERELLDAEKKNSINRILRGIAFKVAELSPAIAASIASITPLAPFAIPIGQSVTFVRDLILHELNAPK